MPKNPATRLDGVWGLGRPDFVVGGPVSLSLIVTAAVFVIMVAQSWLVAGFS